MIVHNFDPVFIDLGWLQIKWYSLSYIFGIILGWIYANSLIRKYDLKILTPKLFDDSIIYIILGIVLGGRLGYVFFYNFDYFAQNFAEVFKIWQGGMSFHGGLVGVIISILIFSKIKKINFFLLTDIISCVAPIGIFLGRVANFINGELYGKASSVPWAVIFPLGGNISRHPSQIYEAILEGVLLFILINFLAIRKKLLFKTGYISATFLILYAIFRILSEYFRAVDEHLGYFLSYLSMGTLLSIITLLAGCLIIIFLKKNE